MKKKRIIISMLTLLCSCTGAWAQSASDVLSGVFTINANGVKVQFSKGNLQKIGSNYQFAEHQYDYIGNNQSDNNKDLFAFNGYSTPDASWFNMSHDQWKYLLATRSVTNSLYAGARYTMATLVGTDKNYKGLIIFPDDYTHPDGSEFKAGTYNGHSDFTATVSLEGWALMEAAGCVFLPAAGYYSYGRKEFGGFGEAVEINTTTSYDDIFFYTPVFKSDDLNYNDKSYKQSLIPVRLAQLKTNLQKDADGYYLIGTLQNWKEFAVLSQIETSPKGKLVADINLGDEQAMIGSFNGIFDGQGHTLTVNLTSTANVCGVFRYVADGATIQNLRIAGTINGAHRWIGGFVGEGTGTYYIKNCISSVTINTTYSGDGVQGGFVAAQRGTLYMNDCIFDGVFNGPNAYTWGGFVGWYYGSSTLTNCLALCDEYNVRMTDVATFIAMSGTLNNCYYKSPIGTAQGTQATAAELADGTTATALQAGRAEIIWVQDPVTNQPMLATFANAVTLTDVNDLTALSAYAGKTCKVTYSRSFTEAKSSTVCLPFAYTKKAGDGSFYEFTDIEKKGGEYVATMTESGESTLTANTPYLYKPNADGSVDFSGTYEIPDELVAGSTVSNGWTFKGTYTTIEWTTAPETPTYGFSASSANDGITQGQFVKVGSYVRIKPMRCYLENANFTGARGMTRAAEEELPETIKVRLIGADGEVTAIGSLQTKTGEVTFDKDAWYSLDGRRIEGKPTVKGIYVNNGKKIVVK